MPRVAGGPELTLDGVLDEPLWRAAASTGPFVHAGSGAPASEQAVRGRARLAWDERWLFVAFEVETENVRGGFPADARDPHLWERDTVELMLDPDGDGDNRDYYEIQVSPQNLVFDSQFDDYNLPRGGPAGPFGHQAWSASVDSGVRVEGTLDDPSDADRGYTVEARIPWTSFAKARRAPPAPGDRWRVNCYAMQDNGGVAWSPILGQGNFHRSRRFGRVRFVAAPAEEATRP
ncbi:MAG: carbohydrate-binding family 9-like protein [Polyangiaceae bacterium]|nr:carbohydrate-binding family 9-like protein [Polyangiaceae bacterium]